MTSLVVDVSHHQGPIDWPRVAAAGVVGAIVKASEAGTYRDPTFVANATGARAAGLLVGAYHFARPGASGGVGDATSEADWYLSTIGERVDFDVLDLEDNGVPAGRSLAAWTYAYLNRVELTRHRLPWLYTFASYWTNHVGNVGEFRRFPLWIAKYGSAPGAPAPWDHWTLWQYTSGGTIPGIPTAGHTDLNQYRGTRDELRALVLGTQPSPSPTPAPQPPTHYPGENMTRVPIQVHTDDHGRGYFDMPAVANGRVVSIVPGGDDPGDGWGPHLPAPPYSIDHAGGARIVVPESPIVNGALDLAVWITD